MLLLRQSYPYFFNTVSNIQYIFGIKFVFNQSYRGNSLIEVVVALLIFSISIAVISRQVDFDIEGVNGVEKHIAEVYRHGI